MSFFWIYARYMIKCSASVKLLTLVEIKYGWIFGSKAYRHAENTQRRTQIVSMINISRQQVYKSIWN